MIRIAPVIAALCALAACSGYEENEPVGAITQSEREALDDAAAMLDERRVPEEALRPADDGVETETESNE